MPSNGIEQDFLLILDGWDIDAVEQDVGEAGADKESGKIQGYTSDGQSCR